MRTVIVTTPKGEQRWFHSEDNMTANNIRDAAYAAYKDLYPVDCQKHNIMLSHNGIAQGTKKLSEISTVTNGNIEFVFHVYH